MVRRSARGLVITAVLPVSVVVAAWVLPTSVAAAQTQGPEAPDVALVVAGGTGRTTALRSGTPGFARLWELLQPTYAGTERVPDAWTEGRYPAVRLTVVWGLSGIGGWPQTSRAPGGDVALERQDQVFLAADGTPWVRTDPAPDVEDDDVRWHRATRDVYDSLRRSGLLGGDGDVGGHGGGGRASGTFRGDRASVVWGAAGVALGVGGTVLIRRAAARRGAGPPRQEPRQELIEL